MSKEIPTIPELVEFADRIENGGELTEEEIQKIRNLIELIAPICKKIANLLAEVVGVFIKEFIELLEAEKQNKKQTLSVKSIEIDGKKFGAGNVHVSGIADNGIRAAMLAEEMSLRQKRRY